MSTFRLQDSGCLRAPERLVAPLSLEKLVLYENRPDRVCAGGSDALSLLNSIVVEIPRGLGQSPGKENH